jgi:ParB family transcriptional regulator, chromosome partitioning protein
MANGLGRGLGSLIPNKTNPPVAIRNDSAPVVQVSDKDKISQIEIGKIKVNPFQPRQQFTDYKLEELVESIKEYGVIQPLIVTKKGDEFELIAGERRLRASKQAGLTKVPVIIRDANAQEKLEIALIENIQRENLNPIDLADAYKKLMDDFSMSQEDVAKKVSKARSSVANTIRLLALPEEIKLAVINDKISEGHAKYLVGLESEEKQMSLFRKILHNNLSVNDTSKVVKKMGGTKAARIKINYADNDKEFALREFFGSKVEIRRKGKGGQIIIDFFSDEELKEMVDKVK